MKRAIWAFIAVGFLAVSCGGGNVGKVKNGVFSDYDNTITVGKALENNKILKGGKWDSVEMNGRKYVKYTASLNEAQIQELLLNLLSNDRDYKDKPNYWSATKFRNNLQRWRGAGNAEILAKVTSMSGEEVNQAFEIFNAKLNAYDVPKEDDFFDYSGIIEGKFNDQWLNDSFLDPYLLTIKDKVTVVKKFTSLRTKQHDHGWFSEGEGLSPKIVDDLIYCVVTTYIVPGYTKLLIENGMFTDEAKSEFDRAFGVTNFADNKDLIDALVRTRTKFYDWHIKAQNDFDKAKAEYEERRKNDIEPLLTIDGYEITISFVMNQDDTFEINMLEIYTEVTLKCFNNLKVWFNVGNSENAQSILSYIYKGFTPNIF